MFRMGIQMRKIMILLFVAIFFLIGCTSEGAANQQENLESTKEDVVVDEAQPSEENTEEKIDETELSKEETEKQSDELSPLEVHYIDAGQGDAALLDFTDGEDSFTILYDTGDWQGDEVVPYLKSKEIEEIDIIIISHPHADHIGQLEDVLHTFDVGEVWMTGNTANSAVYEKAAEAILASDANYDEPEAGDVFDIGALTVTVLHPQTLTGGLNEDSLSVHFQYGDTAFLFTGDAYIEQEEQMIASSANIEADFLQLGHHGSKTSTGQAFLDAVDPTYAIYSAGAGNSYGHPNQEVLDRLQAKNITIYGTDVHGDIVVTTDGIDTNITTEKKGKVAAGKKSSDQTSEKKRASEAKDTTEENQASSGNCVDINSASISELQEIIHIGEKRAEQLIELRPFNNVSELERINGIGQARMDDIMEENKACIGGN